MKFDRFEKATRKNKKYKAILKDKDGNEKSVHFGSTSYEQYKDTTGLGIWSHKDHNDEKRRSNFRSRMGKAAKKKYSPAFFSYHYLW